jgi:hypothetical protein
MMRSVASLILFFLIISCVRNKEKSVNKILFSEYYKCFNSIKLPINITEDFFKTNVDTSSHVNYLLDYRLFDSTYLNDYSINEFQFPVIGTIDKINTNKNFYILLYPKNDYNHGYYQYILATFDKNNFKKISQLIVYAEQFTKYIVESKVDKDLLIEIKYILSWKLNCETCPDSFINKYLYITSYNENYKITEEGKIVLIKRSEKNNCHGIFSHGKFQFPVKLPPDIDSLKIWRALF